MSTKARGRKRGFPNPFFALLLGTSTFFVVTCFAYLISPTVLEQARDRPGPPTTSRQLAAWLDRHGPAALGVEFVVMLAAGALAMVTDKWFPEKPARPIKTPEAGP